MTKKKQLLDRVVVGLDTASDRWHAWTGDDSELCAHVSRIKQSEADERRHMLFSAARSYFSRLPEGTLIACEEPLGISKNGKTTRLLGLAAGAIWAAHLDFPVYWLWVDIAAWKKRIVGNGNANKDLVRAWALKSHFGLDVVPPDGILYDNEPDYYDAMALHYYGKAFLYDSRQ